MKLIGTILPSDPYDERDGAYMAAQDWRTFDKLPPGTKIYAELPHESYERPPVQPEGSAW